MKKISILLIVFLFLCIDAYSQKVAYAVFKDSTLTFYYKDKKPKGAYDVEEMVTIQLDHGGDSYAKEWAFVRYQIKTVFFDNSFKEYRPKSCSRWFESCENLTSIIGIKENLNTSEVTDMSWMFWDCDNLTSLDVSGFNTDKVTDMSWMFRGCKNLTSLDVSGFNTENVSVMDGMFSGCSNLTSLDVSGFNTDKVTSMTWMFWGCKNLTSLDVSGFNTDKVTNMRGMFEGCKNLTSLDVSGFNTENVTDMWAMFLGCKNLKTIYVGAGWNTSNVQHSKFMFNNCPNLIGGQGTKFDPSHTDASYAHIDGGESNPGYFTKKN